MRHTKGIRELLKREHALMVVAEQLDDGGCVLARSTPQAFTAVRIGRDAVAWNPIGTSAIHVYGIIRSLGADGRWLLWTEIPRMRLEVSAINLDSMKAVGADSTGMALNPTVAAELDRKFHHAVEKFRAARIARWHGGVAARKAERLASREHLR